MTFGIQSSPEAPAFRRNLTIQILGDIIRGKLPAGHRLVEQDLATQYNVSRTPIREALAELAAAGFIELRHNRGAILNPFGRKQLLDIYQLRTILESAATRLACGKINPLKLESLHVRLTLLSRQTDVPDWSKRAMALDRRLHDLISRHSENDRLMREISLLRGFLQAVRLAVGDHQHAQRLAIADHLKIIDALMANDAQAAQDAMTAHLNLTGKLAADTLFPSSKESVRKSPG
jgi:DNA-binding GntR family transcriptional regulator